MTYEQARNGCYDGTARLGDMDIDGVDAEILFPPQRTIGHFLGDDDDDFVRAGIDAYNNFLWDEFCAPDRSRLVGMAQIGSTGVDDAVDTLRKAKARGFKGVVISCWPSAKDGISDDDDPFWAAAEEEQMPVCIHINLISRAARQRTRAAQAKAGKGSNQLYGSRDEQKSKANAKAVGGLAGVFSTVPEHDGPAHLHRCVRALPEPAHPADRDGRRMDPAPARADGRPLLAQPFVGQHPDHRAAVVLLVPQPVGHLHHRPQRHRQPPRASASTT